jgi:hypothetical protein
MPTCYYTCNLVPLDLVVRSGYSPRWLGNHLRDPNAPARREALSIHPMTCPYVTKLVLAADELFGNAAGVRATAGVGAVTSVGAAGDRLVVPGGCDAARRMGDLLAAAYPGRVFVMHMPRSSEDGVIDSVADSLRRLEDWLGGGRLAGGNDTATTADGEEPPSVDYPAEPTPGGVFVVAGPLTDNSLLRLIVQLGVPVAGLESCTSPDRWRALAATSTGTLAANAADSRATDYETLAAKLLQVGMCPRRSTMARRDYLMRRLDEMRPSSVIYARQSFCDPGAYDSLIVAELARERDLPYLEIEVDFPFDATGPLRTRVEAFLEAQLLDDDLLRDHRESAAPAASTTADPACGVACGVPAGAGRQNEVSLDDDLGDDLFDEED